MRYQLYSRLFSFPYGTVSVEVAKTSDTKRAGIMHDNATAQFHWESHNIPSFDVQVCDD